MFVAAIVVLSACGENCEQVNAELNRVKLELAQKDSALQMMGFTFEKIDSNLIAMRGVESELMLQLRKPNRDEEAIQTNVNRLKGILDMNNQYINDLEAHVVASNETSGALFSIIGSMEDKMMSNNLRLIRLNADLSEIGDDFKNVFDDYMMAEFQKMELEENLSAMEGSLSSMEERVRNLQNDLNQAYYAIGTKRELIKKGVLVKGGLIRQDDVNENVDLSAFTKIDIRKTTKFPVDAKKFKIESEHPSQSYEAKDGEIVVTDAELFWSLSKYLIITTE